MKPENKQFLDDNRHHYDIYVRAQYIQHFDSATRQRMLDVIHEEFNPGYIGTLWCQSCIADMLKYCYVQYDKWIAAQPKEEPTPEEVAKPAELDGAVLKTAFPLHEKPKKKRRGKR